MKETFQLLTQSILLNKIDYKELNKNKNIINSFKVISKGIYSIEAKKQLDKLLDENKIDIAHLNNIHHYLTTSIIFALKKRKVPIIWTLHDYSVLCPNTTFISNDKICEKCKKHKYYNCIVNKCKKNSMLASIPASLESFNNFLLNPYKYVDYFICPSKFIYNKFLEFGFPSEKLLQANNPYFIDKNDVELPQAANKEDYIIFVGNLIKVKGIYTLIKAMKEIPIKLYVLGDGEEMPNLKNYIETNKVENVVLLGRVNKNSVKEFIKNSLAIVQPSEWYENMPYSLIEAMINKKPIVGARIGGIPELVIDGITGYTFTPFNVEDLRNKILKMISDKTNMKKLGKNAKEHVLSHIRPENYYIKLEAIFNNLNLLNS